MPICPCRPCGAYCDCMCHENDPSHASAGEEKGYDLSIY